MRRFILIVVAGLVLATCQVRASGEHVHPFLERWKYDVSKDEVYDVTAHFSYLFTYDSSNQESGFFPFLVKLLTVINTNISVLILAVLLRLIKTLRFW